MQADNNLNQLQSNKSNSNLEDSACTVQVPNITSADYVLMSADVVLKMTTILKEMRIIQQCSKSEQTLVTLIIYDSHSFGLNYLKINEQVKSIQVKVRLHIFLIFSYLAKMFPSLSRNDNIFARNESIRKICKGRQ